MRRLRSPGSLSIVGQPVPRLCKIAVLCFSLWRLGQPVGITVSQLVLDLAPRSEQATPNTSLPRQRALLQLP